MQQDSPTVHPYELRAHNTKSLLQRLYREVATLIGEEVALAKSEAHQRGAIALVAARTFAFSIACALVALICVSASAVAALALVTSVWAAALIVGAVLIVAALSLRATAGRTLARATEPALSKLNVLLSPVEDGGTLAERAARIEWSRRQVDQTITALSHKTDILSPLRETAFGLGSLGVAVSALVRNDKGKHN